MKTKLRIVGWLVLLALSMFNLKLSTAHAQGTAFTYQSRLNDGANPATGVYDLRFTIYDAAGGGNAGGVFTNAATPVTNGLFTVTLDYGSGVFDGNARWLEIAVRTNGATAFTTLAPRQPLTPTPYAILAGTAGGLSGTLPVSQVSGVMPLAQLPAAVMTNNATGVTLGGTFNGNATTATTLGSLVTNTAPPVPSSINVCWGDSLTYGTGAAPGLGYPDDLVSMLNTATINQGWSGYNSTQIKTVFQANPSLWVYPTIIWSGRNNYSDSNAVLADIATMVSDLNSVGNSNYLVMAIINATNETIGTAGYVQITNLNHYLSAIYSNQFFDVRKFLVNAANTNFPFDLFTFTNDTPAAGLHARADAIHLNAAGYLLVAEGVLQSSFLNQDKNVVSEGKIRALIGQALAAPPYIGGVKPNAVFSWMVVVTNSQYGGSGTFSIVGDSGLQIQNNDGQIYMTGQALGSSGNPVNSVYANNYYGNAQGLTGLNASQLTSGTISLAQLPSAVVTNNESGVTLGSLNVSGITAVSANLVMNDKDIQLRSTYDHGIGWYGSGKPFAGVSVDGPVVYGYSGGGLGTVQTGNVTNLALYWNAAGNVGIGTTSPDALLTVNGTADKPGGGSWSTFSDVRLKKNIQPLSGVLQKLLELRGVSFEYKEPEKIHELSGERIGMIAQEVEQVFPDWVESGPGGYKRLTYRGFEALTVEALRELRDEKDVQLQARDAEMQGLNQKLEQKETEITELKARLERLEQLVTAKNGGGR